MSTVDAAYAYADIRDQICIRVWNVKNTLRPL